MDEILFRNGAVFDGTRFLPAGTCVRIRAGRIVEVGPAASPGAAEPVDLGGGTLLPGFIDAHAHPVFAGYQLRRCDLNAGPSTRPTTSRSSPPTPGIIQARSGSPAAAGRWPRSPAAFRPGISWTRWCADRPVFLPNRDGHGAWVNSRALMLAGIDSRTPDPPDGRIERDADGEPVGMLQEGAASLVARLLPPVTEEDYYLGLLAAQDYLLSLGITGWQDAILGRVMDEADPTNAYLRAAQAGTLRAKVVGALWWDRHQGLDQLPELLHRRNTGQAGSFRASSVKMMLDGVAENHTAAMLEPYLDGDGCPTSQAGLDFIDPAELPRFVTALDRAGFQVHFHALGDRAVRHALDAIEAARRHNGAPSGAAPPRSPPGGTPGRRSPLRGARRDRQHPAPVGHARTADGRPHDPVPGRAPGGLAVPVPLAARRGCGAVRWQRLARQ